MGALILLVLVISVAAVAVIRLRTITRWRDEAPDDEEWVTQLRSFNSAHKQAKRQRKHQNRRPQQRRKR